MVAFNNFLESAVWVRIVLIGDILFFQFFFDQGIDQTIDSADEMGRDEIK